nr:ribonuclease H-like domain, reverse transcriptase, RNA-dependent DNA polymerase [Tanacetum cinerariifolium]
MALKLADTHNMIAFLTKSDASEERMGYEKPLTKLTFYKAFFSAQWKFLIHTILQCMSAKRTAWNEFSSSMASAVICLATGMFMPQQVQVDINAAVEDEDVANDVADVVADADAEPTPPSPTSTTTSPPPQQELISSPPQRMHPNRRKIAKIDVDEDVTLEDVAAEVTKDVDVQGRLEESQAQVYQLDLEHAAKVLSIQDDEVEPAELKEVIEVVTTAKLITEVVTVAATTTTAAPSATRRRTGVVIRDPKEATTPSVIMHSKPKSKDKGKGILVDEPKPLKKQAQIEQDEEYARELEAKLNANINWNEVIKQVKRKKKQDNTVMRYQDLKRKLQTKAQARRNMMKGEEELEEEASKQSKRKSKSSEQQAAKKQKLDEEIEELKTHLQIIPNDEDDFYTEATPLALKVPVLRYFNREDLEMLWKIIQERFASSEPKNFSDDFLLNTLKTMFEKPDVEASIWKSQSGRYGLAKFKSWKLLESCGVHIITFTTTQMILLVERRYPLTRFTLDQMLNNEGPKMDAERIIALRKRTRKEKVEKDQTFKKQKGDELEHDNTEKQKLEEQHEAKEIKKNLEVVPDDKDDVFVNVTPLSSKPPTIMDYKIYNEGKKGHFQISRANGNH